MTGVVYSFYSPKVAPTAVLLFQKPPPPVEGVCEGIPAATVRVIVVTPPLAPVLRVTVSEIEGGVVALLGLETLVGTLVGVLVDEGVD